LQQHSIKLLNAIHDSITTDKLCFGEFVNLENKVFVLTSSYTQLLVIKFVKRTKTS